jgi:hypothetical protein
LPCALCAFCCGPLPDQALRLAPPARQEKHVHTAQALLGTGRELNEFLSKLMDDIANLKAMLRAISIGARCAWHPGCVAPHLASCICACAALQSTTVRAARCGRPHALPAAGPAAPHRVRLPAPAWRSHRSRHPHPQGAHPCSRDVHGRV